MSLLISITILSCSSFTIFQTLLENHPAQVHSSPLPAKTISSSVITFQSPRLKPCYCPPTLQSVPLNYCIGFVVLPWNFTDSWKKTGIPQARPLRRLTSSSFELLLFFSSFTTHILACLQPTLLLLRHWIELPCIGHFSPPIPLERSIIVDTRFIIPPSLPRAPY